MSETRLADAACPVSGLGPMLAPYAQRVVLTDINDFRLELAQKGAPGVRTVNTTKEDIHDVMKELGLKGSILNRQVPGFVTAVVAGAGGMNNFGGPGQANQQERRPSGSVTLTPAACSSLIFASMSRTEKPM